MTKPLPLLIGLIAMALASCSSSDGAEATAEGESGGSGGSAASGGGQAGAAGKGAPGGSGGSGGSGGASGKGGAGGGGAAAVMAGGSSGAGGGSAGAGGKTAGGSGGAAGVMAGGNSGSGEAMAGGSSGSGGSGGASGAGGAAGQGGGKAKLLFGVVEEQLAVCFSGETYPCPAIADDDKRRATLGQIAPGLTVRWGGYETERTGFGLPGAAARRAFENLGTAGGQLEPSWLVERAKKASYGSFILAVPVTVSTGQVPGGAIDWKPSHAEAALDAWKAAVDQGGFVPPAYIELGNEPWNKPAGTPDGYTKDPKGYADEAREIGKAVAQKIASFGWPTRIAVVVDNWPGTSFESPTSVAFPPETIALAAELAKLLPGDQRPVLQTHAYPLHGGYWCPKAASVSDGSDLACVYALYTMLRRIKQLSPEADLIVTEDNFDDSKYPDAGVYTTLSSLLAYAAGAVAYTHFGNNSYQHKGDRYELFDGFSPVPLLANDIPRIAGVVAGLSAGEVSLVSATGQVAVKSGGYASLVSKDTAPSPYGGSGTAPTQYEIKAGAKTVSVDVLARKVTVSP